MLDKIKINILKKSKYFSIDETHSYLKVLGFPTDSNYGHYQHADYLSGSISNIEDLELLKKLLLCYEPENGDLLRTWKTGYYRLFVSHRSEFKVEVSQIKDYLLNFGIDAFVAHEDINVSVEWRDALIESLKTMHCLVAYITDNFSENDWCSQEVGFATVSGARIIPMKVGSTDPSGFLGFLQAVNSSTMSSNEKSNYILEKLLELDRDQLIESMLYSLNTDSNFSKTKDILEFLVHRAVKLTSSSLQKLEDICKSNDQVGGYYYAEKYLNSIMENSVNKVEA